MLLKIWLDTSLVNFLLLERSNPTIRIPKSNMEIKSYSKYMRISPKKAREVARILPGRKATEGVSLLKYIPRKAARMLNKTLRSAMANAENNANLNADDLTILEAIVEEGPALKRFRPCARGSAHPYKKRMSHLRITLTDEKI
jgi:large subunit ribosomal protein L22